MDVDTEIRALRQRLDAVEKRAQTAEDHIAVANLQRTYDFYVDKFQWDQVADLFARDATLQINGSGRGRFRGQDRIRKYMRHSAPPSAAW